MLRLLCKLICSLVALEGQAHASAKTHESRLAIVRKDLCVRKDASKSVVHVSVNLVLCTFLFYAQGTEN